MKTNETENTLVFKLRDRHKVVYTIEDDGLHWRLVSPEYFELAHIRCDPSDAMELQEFLAKQTVWDKDEI